MMFAWSEDDLLPRGFGRTNARQAPVLPTLVTAVLALVFLVQEALVGFQIGVALRSITFMLVIAVVGIGWMRLRRNGAPPWAAALVRRRDLLFAAPAAVFVAVVLIAMGLVQPDTPVLLQPVSQAVIALLVAAMLWAAAKRRATATQSNWPPSQGEITPNG
jgi:amino acid transporter